MLIRCTPRAVLSACTITFLISICWLYFKNSDYDAAALWEAAVTYAEPQGGRTGPDGADEPAARPHSPENDRFPEIANSFGESRQKGGLRTYMPKPAGYNYSTVLVVPRTKEDTQWAEGVAEEMGMQVKIYDLDGKGENQVPKNKGNEAMVYLTYIIDNYSNLPEIVLFFHASRQAWHNNALLDIDSVLTIKRLNLERVDRLGYMNARCHHDPGCPDWIHMDRPEVDFDIEGKPEEQYLTKSVWRELFPGTQPPPALSQPCCAQFAVTRDVILQNPKSKYIYFRDWLINTSLKDKYSGRVFEYTWQYIFTGHAELCPIMNSCYCDGYGICFGGAKALDSWLTRLEKLQKLQDELVGDEMQKPANAAKHKELQAKVDKLEGELKAEKLAAYERGNDAVNRERERERTD